jgi:toxin CcdB
MSRFDIFANPGKNRRNIPYLVTPPPDLFPIISVNGEDHVMDTPQLGAIPLSELKVNVASARAYQFEIQSALDRLLGAY